MAIYSGIIFVIFIGLLLFGCRLDDSDHSSFMSIHETQCLKGVLALEVVLCHIYAYYREGIALRLFNMAAYISVAMFFLFAGYGLVVSAKHKKDYIKGFLFKRLSKLYIPLWLSLVIAAIARFLLGAERSYTFETIIKDILGLNAIWFFMVIVIYYIAFYLVWKCTKGKNAVLILSIFTIVQCVLCAVMNMNKQYYTSSFGFILGMLLAEDKETGYTWIKQTTQKLKKSRLALIGSIVCFFAIGVGYVVIHDTLVGALILRNLIGIIIVGCILVLLYYFRIGNKASEIIGKYSYEIYLLHPAVIISVKQGYAGGLPSGIQVMLILLFTFALSAVLGESSKRVLGMRRK